MKIAIIGAGNMGGAIARGLASLGQDMELAVANPSQPKLEALREYSSNIQTFADNAEARELVRQRLEDFEAQMHYPLLPGSMEYVIALREKGWGLAVVTSSDRVKMDCFYRSHPDFPQLFHRIFTAEDVEHSKPAPDGYVKAAHCFGLAPEACVVFEDSLNGLRAGRASGAKLVGLTTSLPAEEITPLCDVVVNDYENLSQLNIEELWQDI